MNNLPLEIRLNVMSFNCYDICPRKYNEIINNPFPSYKSLIERSRFFAMPLTEIWGGEKSQYDIYTELNTFYTYSYIHEILLMFKRLYFIHGLEKMEKWKQEALQIEYYHAMRDVSGIMPQKKAFAYHIQLYEDLNMEECSDDDVDDDIDSDYYSD